MVQVGAGEDGDGHLEGLLNFDDLGQQLLLGGFAHLDAHLVRENDDAHLLLQVQILDHLFNVAEHPAPVCGVFGEGLAAFDLHERGVEVESGNG